MFNINKIKAHIKMLNFEREKLEKYLAHTESQEKVDIVRVKDIKQALNRVLRNIEAYTNKIAKFETATPDAPARAAIRDPNGPLIQ